MTYKKENKLNNLAVLIIGYDGYKDVWNHFVYFINKYWAERPKTYFATSELEPEYENIEIVKAGVGSEWSKKAFTALNKIDTKYVLLLLEDFFIMDYVDNEKISEILKFIEVNQVKFYQLTTQYISNYFIEGKTLKDNKYIHIIPKNKKYGINLQAAIWNTDFLKQIIGQGNYNAWTFESNNAYIKDYDENKLEYLIDERNILHILHAIKQSKYFPHVFNLCKKIDHTIDISERQVLNGMDYFKYQLKHILYSLLPKRLFRPFKRFAKHLNFSFVTDK